MAHSEKNEDNKGVHPAAAALTGLVIGVAAGVAMTTLSDKDKRAKANKKLDEVSKQAKKSYDEMAEEVERLKGKVKEAADEAESVATKVRDSILRAGEQVAEKMDESGKVVEAEVEEVVAEAKRASRTTKDQTIN